MKKRKKKERKKKAVPIPFLHFSLSTFHLYNEIDAIYKILLEDK
jgi:hypothetical protein